MCVLSMDFHGGEYKGRRGKRFQETHGMCNPIFTDFRNSRGGGVKPVTETSTAKVDKKV